MKIKYIKVIIEKLYNNVIYKIEYIRKLTAELKTISVWDMSLTILSQFGHDSSAWNRKIN